MTTQLELGEYLKKQGIKTVIDHNKEWMQKAISIVIRLCWLMNRDCCRKSSNEFIPC